jgi:trehalose synthase
MTLLMHSQPHELRDIYTPPRNWARYKPYVDADLEAEVLESARHLSGCRVVHVNATPTGGGVAEILVSLVPVLRSLGLDAHWLTLPPKDAFFAVTKKLHNALQGDPAGLAPDDWQVYFDALEELAVNVDSSSADVWVIHDPQPLPLRTLVPLGSRVIWRCHIDCSAPNPAVAARLLPWVQAYDTAVFSMPAYILPGVRAAQTVLEYPAIDPLMPKNQPLNGTAANVVAGLGLDPRRPLVTQVSRFDPWKNPWQAIDAYRLAKRSVPELQLAMLGVFSAKDDPQGPEVYASVRDHARGDPDVHLFTDPLWVGDQEVNAFQTASDVVLQRSIREGFGLVVTEAMWKARPVIGTPVGGIAAQIEHGQNGVLVADTEGCAEWIVRLTREPELAESMGEAARASVRARFLLPRLVRDELALYAGSRDNGGDRPVTSGVLLGSPAVL